MKPESRKLELTEHDGDGNAADEASAEARPAKATSASPPATGLMERVCERANLNAAWRKVVKNKGSAGVDGMTVEELPRYLREHGTQLREQLLASSYRPQPIKQVMIPKADGGQRMLGIPTVVDRFVQQAILQVLQPLFDPTFSPNSFGFRPKRSAHDAILSAKRLVQDGRTWVVDLDLAKFFDTVNHDILMGRLAKRIADKALLRLLRLYLQAGMFAGGLVQSREAGTPQGGPLSPLLANVLLDEVDKELERRGHGFVRYADDLNVYVKSQAAGERVMRALRAHYAKLRLQVNDEKSAVAPVYERKFLGFTLSVEAGTARVAVAAKTVQRFKTTVRALTRRTAGQSMATVIGRLSVYVRGWYGYFGRADRCYLFSDLDAWIRRRLRCVQLAQWRRGPTIYRALRALGNGDEYARKIAAYAGRWAWLARYGANKALPNKYFTDLGLILMERPKKAP